MFIEQVGKSSGEIDGMQDPLIDGAGSSENYFVAAAIFLLVSPFSFSLIFSCARYWDKIIG